MKNNLKNDIISFEGDNIMKKLLVVVDYQVDFVSGALGFDAALSLEDKIVDKIIEFENNDDEVIFTLDTHYENYHETVEGVNLPIAHCIKGTNGHELYGEVKNLSLIHKVFEKETFGSSRLFNYLMENKYDEIYFCGVVTNICVISNAVVAKAALPNANIYILKDLVASNDKEIEEKSFDIMRNLHMQII